MEVGSEDGSYHTEVETTVPGKRLEGQTQLSSVSRLPSRTRETHSSGGEVRSKLASSESAVQMHEVICESTASAEVRLGLWSFSKSMSGHVSAFSEHRPRPVWLSGWPAVSQRTARPGSRAA